MALRLMVVPLAPGVCGPLGEKAGLVMTTLAWAGAGGVGAVVAGVG